MQGRLAIIHPSTYDVAHVTITTTARLPNLKELQSALNGYIELVPFFSSCRPLFKDALRCEAYCNEDGKVIGLPRNILATRLWHGIAPQMAGDYLAGPVIIISGDAAFFGNHQ